MSALKRYYRARYTRFRALLRWRQHLPGLIKAAKEVLPDAELYVFGSAVRGELTANSDVDVLIVSDGVIGWQRHKIGAAIEERLEKALIFEIHLVTQQEMGWYKRHAEQLVPAERIVGHYDREEGEGCS